MFRLCSYFFQFPAILYPPSKPDYIGEMKQLLKEIEKIKYLSAKKVRNKFCYVLIVKYSRLGYVRESIKIMLRLLADIRNYLFKISKKFSKVLSISP